MRSPVLRTAWILAATVLAAGSASAGEPPDEERLRRLEEILTRQEEELARLRGELEALRGGDAATPAPATATESAPVLVSVRPAVSPPPTGGPTIPIRLPDDPPGALSHRLAGEWDDSPGLRWGGYLELDYTAPSNKDSWADLYRLILAFGASLTDRIDLRAELEFEHGGIGGAKDGEAVVEYLDARFHVCDAFVPKVGALLIPFGRYNLYHDDPYNDFTLRPFTARFLVPTGFGQPGIGAEGALPFGCGHLITYDTAITCGYDDDFKPSRGVRDARQSWRLDNNEQKQAWGRVAVALETCWADTLEIGASGTWGRYDDAGDNDIWGYGFDFLLRRGPWEFKGEYIAYDLERDASDPASAVRGQDGLWLEAGFHFMPASWRRCPGAFVTDDSHFTLAARYQHMDTHDLVTGAAFEDDLDAWSIGLNYRITERTLFRIDHTWYEPIHGEQVREFTASFATWF